jgi:hypothetical protein
MTIFDLFSKRARAQRGEIPDVYQYENMPEPLRVQIIHIMKDALGDPDAYNSRTVQYHKIIYETLCREYGVFSLSGSTSRRGPDYIGEVYNFLLGETDIEKVLDVVELGFRVIDRLCREYTFTGYSNPKIKPDDAIEELNARMRYHGVGYQYESGEIVRVDSQIIHKEAVKPALELLRTKGFEGPNDEFLKAFEHYRHGMHKEAINEALKSFESTMKVLCRINKWNYDEKDTASKLIDHCMSNNIIPEYLQTHYKSLGASLKSGVPTIRNREGGHGQGESKTEVPDYLVSYHLHLTASAILMLISANKALKGTP